jgi:hypothetical protein
VDHVGSLHEFSERIIHRAEAHELDVRSEPFSLLREDHPRDVIDMFERAGYEVGRTLVSALPHPAFNLTEFGRPAAPATRLVEEGDVIDLGDRVFEILHLPGHSPGGIGLWEASTATLFSGDAIYDGPLLDELPGSDIPTYLETMRRLVALGAQAFRHQTQQLIADPVTVSTIIKKAQALGLGVVAEGVEDFSQLLQLQDEKCDQAQGFLLSRPLPVADTRAFLMRLAKSQDTSRTVRLRKMTQ